MGNGLWYTERFKDQSAFALRVTRSLHCERSAFQQIEIIETPYLGRVLALDGVFMTSERDEFYYHEMIVHPALVSAPRVERVLVIGGGDGGTVREVLRHPGVERCLMVEIDERVVRACQAHLPALGGEAWNDPRLSLRFENGVDFVQSAPAGSFDVVILDGSDPAGPSAGLFNRRFYESVRRVLAPDGVFVCQSESPTAYASVFFEIQEVTREVFGRAAPYFGTVVLYAAGLWTWTIAGRPDPMTLHESRLAHVEPGCRYYNREIHRAAFAQPSFVARRLSS